MAERWYQRYSWVLLVLMQFLILLVVSSGPEGPVAPGSVLHAFFASQGSEAVLEQRLLGTILWGMVIFGLAIILVPFRNRERWAWYVLWYYPAFFAIHIVAFGTLIPDVVFLLICVLGLLLPYRRFFSKDALANNPPA